MSSRSAIRHVVVSLAVVALLAGCGGSGSDGGDGGGGKPAPAAQTPTAVADAQPCTYTASGDAAKQADLPPSQPVAVPSMTISTNFGDLVVTFDSTAPCTVNSFVSLANQGYFDDTTCHRLVPAFVLQCGDPAASGLGGPGYSFADELSGSEQYTEGTLAMANAGPNTNGSQFFIVLTDVQLAASYTVFGTVDAAGMKVAHKIEANGNATDSEAPKEAVKIAWVR